MVDPTRIWLTGFWGFGHEEDGVLGFTKETDRARFLDEANERQLVCVYGVVSPETVKADERRLLGMLEVERRPIDSHSRMSPESLKRNKEKGWNTKWRFAVPVRRAWRTKHAEHVDLLFPKSYDKKKGLFIASFGTWLVPDEAKRVINNIPFFETNVWGEPPITEQSEPRPLSSLLSPSKAVLQGFGSYQVTIFDRPHWLYLATVQEGADLLAGRPLKNGEAIWKIGITGDPERRRKALNLSFPSTSKLRWNFHRSSKYQGRALAAKAEQAFKDGAVAAISGSSLGNEYFLLERSLAESLFDQVSVPTGVAIRS